MKKFTMQDVIDMGAELYDKKGFTREQIWQWLTILQDNDLAEFDLYAVYDLIVG